MTIVKLFLTFISLLNKIYQEYIRRKWIRHGYQEAIDDADKEQNKRVKKARQARDNITDQPIDSLHNDPYLRD